MFKLIIADDEVRIREGFKRIVNWESLGFRVVGSYSDGEQVLQHLEREHADVVLTDIKMKNVGGLEVAEHIQREYPNTMCVLVSAHQEFDFAQTALSFGVKDYLLKPTRISDIRKVFSAIAEKLEQECELLSRQMQKERQYEEMFQLSRKQFIYDLYMGTIPDEAILLQQAGHYYPGHRTCALISCRLGVRYPESENAEEVKKVLRRVFQGDAEGIAYDPIIPDAKTLIVLAVVEQAGLVQQREGLPHLIDVLREEAAVFIDLTLDVQSVDAYDTMFAYANRPRNSLRSSGTNGQMRLDQDSTALLLEQQRLFISYVSGGNLDQARILAQFIAQELCRLPTSVMVSVMVDMVAGMQVRLTQLRLVEPFIPRYDLLLMENNAQAVTQWFLDQTEQWIAHLPAEHSPAQVVAQIKEYVQLHFCEPVSLEVIAEHVFLSAVYVSRLFKRETGENFTDYITRLRIERACELLRHTALNVYQVGEMVGYANPRYFYRVFKSSVGLTPSEYRRRYAEGKSNA